MSDNVIKFPTPESQLADALTDEHYETAEAVFAPTIHVQLPTPSKGAVVAHLIGQLLFGALIGTALVLLVLA